MTAPLGFDTYKAAAEHFAWRIPERFNIGVDVCDRWAEAFPDRPAIIEVDESGSARTTGYGELRDLSDRLGALLLDRGVRRGDRVAILLPQRLETALAHIAVYKLGAVAVPLFTLFGPDALVHRLRDSGASAIVTDTPNLAVIAGLGDQLPALQHLIDVDASTGTPSLLDRLAGSSARIAAADTAADDPALIIYTSGTTGAAKGALHAHRVLLGHLPGVEMSHDGLPKPGDRFWTPADWAWIGGLLDVLLPSLHHGVPVVARRFRKFDPEAAFALMARQEVRNVFLPPTALKMLRTVDTPRRRWDLRLRSIASGGESLGAELLDWGRRELGVQINEFYGQTECNVVLSSCSAWFPPSPGAIGKAVPGHRVAVLDDGGRPAALGAQGQIAVRQPDPVMFLGYWNNAAATAAKFQGDWLLTGDIGVQDDEGLIRFVARDDDVITSAGYRIGPAEIEDCLLRHPAVQAVGVVGAPDQTRTEAVAAAVVLKPGFSGGAGLTEDLQSHVRTRLGAHQYPRVVAYIDALPMTATGKIMRRELRAMFTSP